MSLSLMEACGYDAAFMFKYSERPGTYASKHLEDNVPEEVKVRRLNEIIALQNRLSAESNQRCIGKTYEVLVEGVSKRSRDQLFGRTEQNRVVVFDRGTHRVGDFVNVRVTEASSATLKGEKSDSPQRTQRSYSHSRGCLVVVTACTVCGNCAYTTHPVGALRINIKNSVPLCPLRPRW